MKLLYVSQFFYPEITAGAFRAFDNATIWRKNNVDVTVYTAYPNYPKGEIYEGYNNKLISKESIEKLDVIRGKVYIRKNTKKLSRGLISLSFLFFSIINIIFNRKKIGENYDVVLGSSGSIFAALAAYLFSLAYKAKFILEIRDITYIQMLATMSDKKSTLYKVIRFLDLFLCKKAKKVVVVTEGFKKQLIEDGVDERKIEVVYNGIMIKENNKKKLNDEKEINKKMNGLTFCYAGTFGISQDITSLIEFYQNLNIKEKKLILIGEGAEKDKITNLIKEKNLNEVIIMESVPKDKLENIYKEVDICIVKLKYNKYFNKTMPSKVFDIMYNRKPILYLGFKGEVSSLIEKAQCGQALCYDNSKLNAEAFYHFYKNYKDVDEFRVHLKQFGENGYKYVINNFDREQLAYNYESIIYELSYNTK